MPEGKAGTIRGFGSVGRYIQGPGAIRCLPRIVERYGRRVVVFGGKRFGDDEADAFRSLFQDSGITVSFQKLWGECSPSEVAFFQDTLRNWPGGVDVVVGFGGGRTLDTVRVIGMQLGLKVILMPTSAATNAAASGLSVLYDHGVGRAVFLNGNPDYIIADTNYIITAPASQLAAGIGDSLATYFEARNNWSVNNVNTVMPGFRPTICGKQIAKACMETLLNCGAAAYLAACHSLRTEDFEDTVEAILLLSGIGWENNGCSIAHGLVEALPAVSDTKGLSHGAGVAFSLLVQLIMDREEPQVFRRVYGLLRALDLPVCLADIGIVDDAPRKVRTIARTAFDSASPGTMNIVNYPADPDSLYNAILYLDALSKRNSGGGGGKEEWVTEIF